MSIVIQEMHEEEKETVRRLLVKSYMQYEGAYTDRAVWDNYLRDIHAAVDDPLAERIYVAKERGAVRGAVSLYIGAEKAYGRPELNIADPIFRYLAVDPEARGKGIGQALVRACIDYARQQQFAKLYLYTGDKMSSAMRLYEWLGFQRSPDNEYYVGDNHVKCYCLPVAAVQ